MSILEQTSQSFSIQDKLSNLDIGTEIKFLWENVIHDKGSLSVQNLSYEDREDDDDIFRIRPTQMNFKEVVEDKGFDFQEYEVRTEDGYLLKMFRIRDKTIVGKSAKAVFMQHGLFACASTFIKYADDDTPAFNLAREGYDVWIGNNRGNLYTHTNNKVDYLIDAKDFHNYSFPELGKYDLPAQIDYALKTSGNDKLTYIGHSQGTSQMFWALSHDQDHYLSRVNGFIALAPVANMAHVDSGVKFSTHLLDAAKYIAESNNIYSLWNPEEMDITHLGNAGLVLMQFANYFGDAFLGHASDPKESSTKMVWHYGQIMKHDGIFAEWSEDNSIPGKKIPLENIDKMPIWLFSGSKDPVATQQDNITNQKQLGNAKLTLVDGFGHSDYLKGKHTEFQKTIVNTVNEINEGSSQVEATLF